MEEIITLNGKEIKIWYENLNDKPKALEEALKIDTAKGNITPLAVTGCTPQPTKHVGDPIHMAVAPTGGTPPYTCTFWVVLVEGGARAVLQSGALTTFDGVIIPSQIGYPTFGVTVTESCGALSSDEYCTVQVLEACVIPVANLTIS